MAMPWVVGYPIALITNAVGNMVGHVLGHKRGKKQADAALALQGKRDTAALALHKEQVDAAMRLQDKRDAAAYKLAILQVKSQAEIKKIDLEFQAWARKRQWEEDRWRTEYVENMRAMIEREKMGVDVWKTEQSIKLQKWKTLQERETALELKRLDGEITLMVAAYKRESDLLVLERRWEQDHQPIWLTLQQFLSGNNLTALRILVCPPDKELNEGFPVAPIVDYHLTRILQYYSTHGRAIQLFDRHFRKRSNNVEDAQQTVAKVLHADLSSIPVLVLNGQLAGLRFLLKYSFWGSNWDDIISDGLVKLDVKFHGNYYARKQVEEWQKARGRAENPEKVDEIYGTKEVERLKYNLEVMTLEKAAQEMGITREFEYKFSSTEMKQITNYLSFLFCVNTAVCADLYFLLYAPMALPLKPLMFECFHDLDIWEDFSKEEIPEMVKEVLASYTQAFEGLKSIGQGVLIPELYLQLSQSMYKLKFYELSKGLVVASVEDWLRQRGVPPSGDLMNLLNLMNLMNLMRDFIICSDRSYIAMLQQCLHDLGVNSYIEDIVPMLDLMAEQEERQRQEAENKEQQQEKEKQEKQHNRLTETVNEGKFKVVEIPAGELMMGGSHRITIQSFLFGETPVTNAQWKAVMGTTPSNRYGSNFAGDNNPVVGISWDNAQEFCEKLSSLIGTEVRLPSEAEWEYAARAGTTNKYFFGDDDGQLAQYAWYCNNSEKHTEPVKNKNPNKWGLYDVLGNVWEWCQDNYTKNTKEIPTDGNPCGSNAYEGGKYRSRRGGAWNNNAGNCACGSRNFNSAHHSHDSIGFRIVFATRTL